MGPGRGTQGRSAGSRLAATGRVVLRGELVVRLARQRASGLLGLDVHESTTVIVGDSLRDIEAGRVGGARAVAVATGRTDADAFREAGAETVLTDLADTEAVLRVVLAESSARA